MKNITKTCIRIIDLATPEPDKVLRCELYYSKGAYVGQPRGYVLLSYVVTTNRHGVREYETAVVGQATRVLVEEAKRFSAKRLGQLAADLCLDDYHHALDRALELGGVGPSVIYLKGISDNVLMTTALAEFERAEV